MNAKITLLCAVGIFCFSLSFSRNMTGLNFENEWTNPTSRNHLTECHSENMAVIAGSALDFNGTSDYVDLPFVLNVAATDFTFELWFKMDNASGDPKTLLSVRDGVNSGTPGKGRNILDIVGTGSNLKLRSHINKSNTVGVTNLDLDTWYHAAVTYDGIANKLTLYLNGNIDKTKTTGAENAYGGLVIGAAKDLSVKFPGQIDELRVWNRVLCQSEIQAQMSCRLSGMETGLLAYYDFENSSTIAGGDNTGEMTLEDKAGSHDGTLTGFMLTGSESNWVDNSALSTSCTPYTGPGINVQGNNINISNGDLSPDILDHTNFDGNSTRTFTIQNNGLTILKIDNPSISGEAAADFSITTLPSTTIAAGNSTSFVITFAPIMEGDRIATVQIADDCGGIYTFTIQAEATAVGALDFDGSGDYIQTPAFFAIGSGDFTFEIWFNIYASATSINTILSIKNGSGSNGRNLIDVVKEGSDLYLRSFINRLNTTGSTSLNTNNWYHAALTYQTSLNELTLYLNGAIEASANLTPEFANGGFVIGAAKDFSAGFPGQMDEFRAWNRALCQEEIIAQMNCKITGSESNLLTYYDFDNPMAFIGGTNTSQTTLEDRSGMNNDGSLSGFSLNGTTSNWVGNYLSGGCAIPYNVVCNNASPIINTPGTHTSAFTGTEGNYTYYCDCAGNLLLGVDVGASGAILPISGVQVQIQANAATFLEYHSGFITNPNGAALLTRQWEVRPLNQPSGEVGIRFFFPASDFAALDATLSAQNSSWGLASVNDMEFFKITNPTLGIFPSLTDITPSDIVEILHGSAATPNSWVSGTYGSDYYAEYTVTSFSGGGGGAGAADGPFLPVSLIDFSVLLQEDETVFLNWQTANEMNNKGFEIERSSDGRNWNQLGFIEGQGTTQVQQSYSFSDKQPITGFNFYRLRQIDFDGASAYSHILVVQVKNPPSDPLVFPNPVRQGLLSIEMPDDGPFQIGIFDLQGNPVFAESYTSKKIALKTAGLVPGIYILSIMTNNRNWHHRVIVY